MNYGICGWFQTKDGLNYSCFRQIESLEKAKEIAKSFVYYEIKKFEFVPEKGYCWNTVESVTYQ